MKKAKFILPLFLTLLISFIIFSIFYKDIYLLGGLKIKYNKDEVQQKAVLLTRDLNINTNGLKLNSKFDANNELIRQVQEDLGFKKGNKLLRNSLPGFYWKIDWTPETKSNITINSDSDHNPRLNESKITISYDNNGNLLQFKRAISDSSTLPSLTPEEAREVVKNFISRFGTIQDLTSDNSADTALPIKYSYISGSNEQYKFKVEKKIELPHRTDYQYTWNGNSTYLKDKIQMDITVSGNVISNFNLSYLVPAKYNTDKNNIYQSSIVIIFYFIIIILLGITAYKKIRAYEIGFRLAFIMAAITIVSMALEIFSKTYENLNWEFLVSITLGPLFVGGAMFISWATSETITRETWKEKFISIDLLTKGYWFHSKVGKTIFDGLTSGFSLSIIWLLLLFIVQHFSSTWSVSYGSLLLSDLNCANPAICILGKSVYSNLFVLAIYLNFVLSGLKRRFNSLPLLLLLGGAIIGLTNSNDIHPVYIGILLEIFVGLIIVWIYYKFDILTALITLITFNVAIKASALFTTGNYYYFLPGYFLLGILVLIILYAFLSVFSKDKTIDFDSITPAFAANITERERLQRELEIAKEVQMSFLPRSDPKFNGLEISSRCLPALEVGGDYYDFVNISDKKIGIIIGDVSGKGTQAAFYMTLTKGFLKALSRISYSPANFLKELNTLFYDNVERGTFISMVYGIFDMEEKRFKLARAGHNPVIVKNSYNGKAETLNSSGLALGLEKGNVFSSSIQEIEVPISSGDVFIFYTDGFTEAMNKSNEEFGEERLISSVESNSGLPANEIQKKIFTEVETFIGKASQHDDMTMVVVKVL
ncbi:MAG: PP2C family protein-serine/threonine phosphatase [Bacteroidetes bacterium]|nr:PP2C family protein-serine/threonine phosphatase [Bacteroidota bacterium]